LAAKLFALAPKHESLRLLSAHVFHLARYDTSYDVRDRGRLLTSLLDNLAPSLFIAVQKDDEEGLDSAPGTVSLRSEQIQMTLFQGKDPVHETQQAIGENADQTGATRNR
jgi:AP-3 complex subunit beta